jgi:hypothetical protein
MDTVLRILKAAGGWNHGLHLHIENPNRSCALEKRESFAPGGAFDRQRLVHAILAFDNPVSPVSQPQPSLRIAQDTPRIFGG